MLRHVPVALFCLLVAVACPPAATAAVITFSSPTIAATQECQDVRGPRLAPLQRYEELGVRILTNELFANRFECDPARAFGPGKQWQPLVLDSSQASYGPLVYWWNDSASMEVTSLNGQPIRGIDLTVVEKNSRVDWCSEIIQAAAGSISLCDGFNGQVNFADYGFIDGLTSFRLDWGRGGAPYFWDPYVVVNAIDVDVPEPGALAVTAIALVAVLWWRARTLARRARSTR
jgi:hypothetical protein